MRVSIVTFSHPSQVTQRFALFIQRALAVFGVESVIYLSPFRDSGWKKLLDADVLFAITPLPLLNLAVGGRPLYEAYSGKIVYYAIDTISHDLSAWPSAREFVQRMQSSDNLYLALPSKDASAFVSSIGMSSESRRHLVDLPFAAFPSSSCCLAKPRSSCSGRFLVCMNIDGVYNLSEISRGLVNALAPFGFSVSQVAMLESALMSQDCPSNPLGIIKEILGFSDDLCVHPARLRVIDLVDGWLKSARRKLLAQTILKLDLPIDLAGAGWPVLPSGSSRARSLGLISHSDFSEIVTRYKAVLNLDPNWDCGFHDRVYTALLSGVSVITQANKAKNLLPEASQCLLHEFSPSLVDLGSVLEATIIASSPPRLPNLDHRLTWVDRVGNLLRRLYS